MALNTDLTLALLFSQGALELYLRSLIALPVKDKTEIVAFFTSGIASEAQRPVARAGYKEGYLTKRGKNFGGWKTRYFVLQGPTLEYYESVSYPFTGSIHLIPAVFPRHFYANFFFRPRTSCPVLLS